MPRRKPDQPDQPETTRPRRRFRPPWIMLAVIAVVPMTLGGAAALKIWNRAAFIASTRAGATPYWQEGLSSDWAKKLLPDNLRFALRRVDNLTFLDGAAYGYDLSGLRHFPEITQLHLFESEVTYERLRPIGELRNLVYLTFHGC